MTIEIRRATPGDVEELARLRWEFRVEHGTQVTMSFETFIEGFRAFARDVLAGDAWHAWVAEDDGRPVGCVWLQVVEKVPHPSRARGERPIVYVTNVYVAPELRNGGLGRRLMDAAIAYARERQVDGVMLWPTERSIPFYERLGFGENGWVWLDLSGD